MSLSAAIRAQDEQRGLRMRRDDQTSWMPATWRQGKSMTEASRTSPPCDACQIVFARALLASKASAGMWNSPLYALLDGKEHVWTGSCPCQGAAMPSCRAVGEAMSARSGKDWPAFHRLIAECRALQLSLESRLLATMAGRGSPTVRADLEQDVRICLRGRRICRLSPTASTSQEPEIMVGEAVSDSIGHKGRNHAARNRAVSAGRTEA